MSDKLLSTLLRIFADIRSGMSARPDIPPAVVDNSISILADWYEGSPDERAPRIVGLLTVLARGDYDSFFDGMDDPDLPQLPRLAYLPVQPGE